MGKIAFVFSGQGAQHSGMGRELYENSEAAKKIFDCADSLRPGTSDQCFYGTAEELSETQNTQPCLFCVDLAAAAALMETGIQADMMAGFSLGELAALTASGALSLEDGFKLVCRRGKMMQEAGKTVDASMMAIIKLDDDTVKSLCGEFEQIYPVNFNCLGQVVVSGERNELEQFKLRVTEQGGRALPLKVSGGFHSPFMAVAAEQFEVELRGYSFNVSSVPVYSNVSAKPYSGDFKGLLSKQICNPVLWRETIENMISAGADTFIEFGPGKVLSGLISRISSDVQIYNVEDVDSLQKTIEGVSNRA